LYALLTPGVAAPSPSLERGMETAPGLAPDKLLTPGFAALAPSLERGIGGEDAHLIAGN
jgi:hypothetical protein